MKTSAGCVSKCVPASQSVFMYFLQDGFLLQPFEKEDRAAPDQAEKNDSCNKVDKPEKTPKKMLSRGEECYSTRSGVLVLDLLHIDFFSSLYYLDNLPLS